MLRGRPQMRWMDNVKTSLDERNVCGAMKSRRMLYKESQGRNGDRL